jgi:hypothetical protein
MLGALSVAVAPTGAVEVEPAGAVAVVALVVVVAVVEDLAMDPTMAAVAEALTMVPTGAVAVDSEEEDLVEAALAAAE